MKFHTSRISDILFAQSRRVTRLNMIAEFVFSFLLTSTEHLINEDAEN